MMQIYESLTIMLISMGSVLFFLGIITVYFGEGKKKRISGLLSILGLFILGFVVSSIHLGFLDIGMINILKKITFWIGAFVIGGLITVVVFMSAIASAEESINALDIFGNHESNQKEKKGAVEDEGKEEMKILQDLKEEIDSLKDEEEMIDTREVESALEAGDIEKADELLEELKKKYQEYKDTINELNQLEDRKASLANKLADGEIDRDTFNEAVESIKHQKHDLEEKLNKLRQEVIHEDYEKPF